MSHGVVNRFSDHEAQKNQPQGLVDRETVLPGEKKDEVKPEVQVNADEKVEEQFVGVSENNPNGELYPPEPGVDQESLPLEKRSTREQVPGVETPADVSSQTAKL